MVTLKVSCGIILASSFAQNLSGDTVVTFDNFPFSLESQLQSKILRWLGHMFSMPDDRLPKKLLFGQVTGHRPPGCPRSSFNDVAVPESQLCCMPKPYKDAQNRMLWRIART